MNITENLTWLEFLSLFILLRTLYVAVKNGFLCEIMKLFAVCVSSFFAFHFYPMLFRNIGADFFQVKQGFADALSFLAVFIFVYVLFFFARNIVFMLIKREEISRRERWMSIPFGCLRAMVIVSLIGFISSLTVTKNKNTLKNSIIFQKIGGITPFMYMKAASGLKRISLMGEINKEVLKNYEVKKNL